MKYPFIKKIIFNEAESKELSQVKLGFNYDEFEPVLSEEAIKYHYGKLYKAYVDKYNNNEGDTDFNEAGAFLHGLYFSQFRPASSNNLPKDTSLEFINNHYKDFNQLKYKVEEEAMTIQGSGWIYLARNGEIKKIKNHAIKSDIILLIDWWEHAMYDYKWDKKGYLEGQWKIINWEVINSRLDRKSSE
jgi:Fe-Mn family superoxide dismutase